MDVENANCKLKVSECADMEILPLERPLKYDVPVTELDHLIKELHSLFSSPNVCVQTVKELMGSYKSDEKQWKKYAKFDRYKYTRNLVDEGNGAFNLIILCWAPGQGSAIHDHADSHCFMKMLKGNLEEVRFDWPSNVTPEVFKKNACSNDRCVQKMECGCAGDGSDPDKMVETKRTRLEENEVVYINDALGLHRMENPSHCNGAVSLHLYCPPFNTCRVFDGRNGTPTNVNITFTSKYGEKIKGEDNLCSRQE